MPRTRTLRSKYRRRSLAAAFVGVTALLCLACLPQSLLELIDPTAHAAMTFTVNSTGDGADSNTADGICNDGTGNCTLRAAIQQANATSGTDTIAFQIPGAGLHTIAPSAALPTISDPVIIDGYTQPGSSVNTLPDGDNAVLLVELSGLNTSVSNGTGVNGLTISAGSSTVRGLVIDRFASSYGISLFNNGNNVIEGNFIGTDAAGAAKAGNLNGIALFNSSNNLIGGTTSAARNVVSGNASDGITLQQTSTSNQIQGNFIGTDASGKLKLGNGSHGLSVIAAGNTVGGTAAGARNVVSGNGQAGVYVQPTTSAPGNVVSGNYIGTDATGIEAVGNSFVGVWLNFAANSVVGGSAPTAGNVISGNGASGILVTSDLSRNNQIGGNLIGTDATGTRPLGNGRDGIEFPDQAHDNFVQQQGPGALPNTIAFNARSGVRLLGAGGNTIRLNNIFSNGALGIDLNGDGVTPNDPGDADPGGNNSQNYPVITSVTSSGGTTNVQGTLNSTPNTVFAIDLFTNSGCDPSGFGEGARYFGSAGVGTDANGNRTFNVNVPQALPAGRVITATATRNTVPRDTSEFSTCSAAGAAGSVEFASAIYNFIEDIGDAPIRVNRVGGSTGTLTVSYATTPGTAAEGTDYTAVTGTITFADGETTKTFNVPIVNDGAVEPDETVGLVLFSTTNPEAVGVRGRAVLNIVDGTKTPSLSFTRAVTAIKEELSGTSLAEYTVSLSAGTGRTVSVHLETADGTATAGVDYQPLSLDLVFAPGEVSKDFAVVINGDTLAEAPNETFFVKLSNPLNATLAQEQVQVVIIDNDTPALRFAAQSFTTNEGAHAFAVTVLRSGVSTGTLTVDYATSDGTATERGDYTTALGTLRFVPGETQKTFTVLLTDDAFQEGAETVNLTLSNPTGGAFINPQGFVNAVLVGQGTATLTITDNDPVTPAANPIDDSAFFVRQHYADFLNREPDVSGFQFWTNEIEKCGADLQCREVKRINVSAAFFLSIEFQETGYFVYRTYKTAYGDATSPNVAGTVPVVRLKEFLSDMQRIGQGVQVGVGDWQTQLVENKNAYVLEFVQGPRFTAEYPSTLTPSQFVDKLNANTGGVLTQDERATLVNTLSSDNTTHGRSVILSVVAEKPVLRQRELNRAFVLMEYYGYLRRNPDDAPESTLNFAGWKFWLDKLNQFNGNFVQAEMVKAFISSTEYRQRFGQ